MTNARLRGKKPQGTIDPPARFDLPSRDFQARSLRPVPPPLEGEARGGAFRSPAPQTCRAITAARPFLLAFLLLAQAAVLNPPIRARQAVAQEPQEPRLRQVVKDLTAPEFAGRSGAGGQKAAAYLVDEFRALKLEPLWSGDFQQAIPGKEPGSVIGHNVGARLGGSDPLRKDEYVILAAHFDHLGVRNGRLYPGADDNASGVAMMLEVARVMAESPRPPRRSLLLIGFDLEENSLFGSRYFVAHSPVPLEKVSLFITADMISRALAGVCEKNVFVFGSEHAPALRPWIDEAARGRNLSVGLLGTDLLVLNRSDYGPFRSKSIPFLFFTTGENPRYHTPDDAPETLDYPKLTAISRTIAQVVRKAVDAEEIPHWQSSPDNPFAEAVAIRDVLEALARNSEQLKIGRPQLYVINNTLGSLDGIVKRGKIKPEERARVIQACRFVLFTVL
jgi:Peptidase family M28